MISILIAVLAAAAIAATVVAIRKHGSLKAAEASAALELKNTIATLESLATKAEGDAKSALTAIVARLRSL